jgi:GntR family transcriptional repressor for pyruvate dehydrogenase complex
MTGIANPTSGGLTRESLADQLADAIVAMILEDGLRTGEPLPSGSVLEARFGVSRTVVREALAALAGQGLISRNQGKETVVAMPQGDQLTTLLRFRILGEGIELDDVLECRLAFEVLGARGAAERRSEEQVAQMRDHLAALRSASTDDDYHRADIAVHRSIMEASGNRLALVILDSFESLLREVRVVATRARRARGESLDVAIAEHVGVVDAIEASDPGEAGRLMGEHLASTAREFRNRRGGARRETETAP